MSDEVRIIWVDSLSWGDEWYEEDDIKQFNIPTCRTVGIIVEENDSDILVAQTDSQGKHGIKRLNMVLIPKGCIKKIKRLR